MPNEDTLYSARHYAAKAKEYAEQASQGQIQADWTQSDTTKVDFIKNKPTKLSDFTDDTASNPVSRATADASGNNIANTYATKTELNQKSSFKLFHHDWFDYQLNDQSWLRADTFSWQDGTVYSDAYNHLFADYNGGTSTTETIGSYTITYVLADDGHKITTDETTVENIYNESGVAWYYILDTTNQRFKLPRTKYGFTGLRDTVGKYVPESLPNIQSTVVFHSANIYGPISGASGAASATGKVEKYSVGTGNNSGNAYASFSINASNYSTAYQDNAPVQQRATQMYLYFYVGQFSQSATEQTAGLNSELFNGKVDLNAANLSTQGKSLISGLGMPSSSYENLTLGADGSTYTPTANGYYSLKCIINNAGAYVQFVVDSLYSSMIAQNAGNGVSIWIPVQKGETCTFHTNASLYVESFKFIYAKGEENV